MIKYKYNLKKLCVFFVLINSGIFCSSVFAVTFSNSTQQKITGTPPELVVNDDLLKKIGFSIGSSVYSEYVTKFKPHEIISINGITAFSDFNMYGLKLADFDLTSNFFDKDGDKPGTPTFTMGKVSYEWIDSEGNVILSDEDPTNINKSIIGCNGDDSFPMPLTLNLKIDDVRAHSLMGLLKEGKSNELKKSFLIQNNVQVCQTERIRNRFQSENEKDSCLMTDGKSPVFGDCDGANDEENSKRLWDFIGRNGLYYMRNQYLNKQGKPACLRVDNSKLYFGNCVQIASNDGYSSMRLWNVKKLNDHDYELLSKFRTDAASATQCLSAGDNNTVTFNTCESTDPNDSISKRIWDSGFFNDKEKPWGPTGIVYYSYSIPNRPATGFNEIVFPMVVDKAPNESSFYYAMQFQFLKKDTSNGSLGYMGLQPRSSNGGLAIFSAFGENIKPIAPHCSGNADGGSGSSCSLSIELIRGREYYLSVRRDKTDSQIWRGYVKDGTTNIEREIGAWRLDDDIVGLGNNQIGFIEYFPSLTSCSEIPLTVGGFGSPTANGTTGQLNNPRTYGKCGELVDFSFSATNDWKISTIKGH